MAKSAKVKSRRGIEEHKLSGGEMTIYIIYQAGGKPRRERIGLKGDKDEFGKDRTLIEADRRLKLRRAEARTARLNHLPWFTPKEREARRIEEEEKERQEAVRLAQQAEDGRRPLLFEEASKRFLDECAEKYAVPQDLKGHHRRLGRAFKGVYLDALTRRDIRRYMEDRANNTGAFADWPRKVGPRAAQMEIVALSALYGYLEEEGYDLPNPCQRPRGRKYGKTKLTLYRPKRKAIIPTKEQLLAIFEATPNPIMKAAAILCYYTAARPESELCQLRHGDIVLPAKDAPPRVLGSITYRRTKTGKDRTVPLHPEAVPALQAIMLDRPADVDTAGAWEQAPVFRRANGSPWTRQSYRDQWAETLEKVTAEHPALRGMWVRDFRKAANTTMRQAGTDPATAAGVLGHSAEQNFDYVVTTTDAAQRAILNL